MRRAGGLARRRVSTVGGRGRFGPLLQFLTPPVNQNDFLQWSTPPAVPVEGVLLGPSGQDRSESEVIAPAAPPAASQPSAAPSSASS